MSIDEVIKELELIKKENGNLSCVTSEKHEYWGSVETKLSKGFNFTVRQAQPEGPKSGKSEYCVVFG